MEVKKFESFFLFFKFGRSLSRMRQSMTSEKFPHTCQLSNINRKEKVKGLKNTQESRMVVLWGGGGAQTAGDL